MSNASGPRIAIDAQISISGEAGGTTSFVLSLVRALGQLTDGSEKYFIIVKPSQLSEWRGLLGANQTLVTRSQWRPATKPPLLVRALRPLRPAVRYLRGVFDSRQWPEVPLSDGFYESLGCHAIHFPAQNYVLCALPTVYNPHDLQHLHYPQFWTPDIIAWRETIYPAGCYFAHTVAVGSEWVKADIVTHYRVQPQKVQVIHEAPSTEAARPPSEEHLAAVRRKYDLPQAFVFYPANTWSHKNHVRLLQALAHLRDKRGLRIDLVCTGARYEPHWPAIEACIDELKLRSQVKFLGFVPQEDLRAIFRLARLLILPTLFEANSLPIFEAWQEGLPVVCSDIPSLREQVADAAALFDPLRVDSIADAMIRNYSDASTTQQLRARGYQRLKQFSWERTAKAYRAVYRRTGGYPLTDEDRRLLNDGAPASLSEKTELRRHA